MLRRTLWTALVFGLVLGAVGPVAADEQAVTITIDRYGTVDDMGQAHITGTISCPPGASVSLYGDMYVRQRVGGRYTDGSGVRGFTDGYGYSGQIACDGTTESWVGSAVSRDVDDQGNYVYKPGPAYASLATFDGEFFVERRVILRPR